MARYVCIHGHFYQPPRESAWLERIERQDSAFPHHDWNARIDEECYRANGRARLLDERGRLRKISNNYARMSFNFGPTLLSWMAAEAPDTYRAILEADAQSIERFGRGSAIAQAYGHLILPLCSDRDRRTQVRWGIDDFKRRFGRMPEGMWLPETAACSDSLRALAEQGIAFTILSPRQAAMVRKLGATEWETVEERTLETRRPYRVELGAGLSIAVFFYDGKTSQAVAFERLLASGDVFAARLLGSFEEEGGDEEQLVHIATDGETYGHHHRFGEMALAYALDRIETHPVELINYAAFLAKHPPQHEARIVERSSWSCAHGVRRWSDDCGCRTRGDRNQAWRGPLRRALDDLRDRIDVAYEDAAGALVHDVWRMRDDYVEVMSDRSEAVRTSFVARHAKHERVDAARVIDLCELQRFRLAMFTSCGWFFDDVSGIETIQILQYAMRAIELASIATGVSLRARFLGDLEQARAAGEGEMSARDVIEKLVLPAQADALRIAAAHAILAAFGRPSLPIPAYTVEEHEVRRAKVAGARVAVGRVSIGSTITGRRRAFAFVARHRGGPEVAVALRETAAMRQDIPELDGLVLGEAGEAAVDALITGMPHRFESLACLPPDDRSVVVERIVDEAASRAEASLRQLFEENARLLSNLAETGVRLPPALVVATRVVLETDLERAASLAIPNAAEMKRLVAEARAENVGFDEEALAFQMASGIIRLCAALRADPGDVARLLALQGLVELAAALPARVDTSRAQELVFLALREPKSELYAAVRERGAVEPFCALAELLGVVVDGLDRASPARSSEPAG